MAQTLISFCLFTFYQIDKSLCKSIVLLIKALCPAWSTHQFPAVFFFSTSAIVMQLRHIKGIERKPYIWHRVIKKLWTVWLKFTSLCTWGWKKKCLAADAVVVSFQLNRDLLIAALAVATVDTLSSVPLTWRSQIRSLCRWPIKWTSWSMIQCIYAVFVDYPPQTDNLSSQSRSIY